MANIIAKCKRDGCGAVTTIVDWKNWWKIDEKASSHFKLYGEVKCSGCGKMTWAQVVRGKKGTRECGSWCTDASTRTCTCSCEGKNHGIKFSHTGALWYSR